MLDNIKRRLFKRSIRHTRRFSVRYNLNRLNLVFRHGHGNRHLAVTADGRRRIRARGEGRLSLCAAQNAAHQTKRQQQRKQFPHSLILLVLFMQDAAAQRKKSCT